MNLKNFTTTSFSLLLYVLTTTTTTTAQELQVGDEICTSGYVMDHYCIDNGVLLDMPSVQTLQGPDQHSVHCLVDVSVCRDSAFEILLPLSDEELASTTNGDLYKRGYRVNEEGRLKLVDLARTTGEYPGCTTCVPGEGTLQKGFHAGIVGYVMALNDDDDNSPIVISVNHTEVTTPDDNSNFCSTYGMEMIDPPNDMMTTADDEENENNTNDENDTNDGESNVPGILNLNRWSLGMLLLLLGSLL